MNYQFYYFLLVGIFSLYDTWKSIFKDPDKLNFMGIIAFICSVLLIASFVLYKMKKKICFQLGSIASILVIVYFAMSVILEFNKITFFEVLVIVLNILVSTFSIWNIHQKKDYVL